MEPVLYAQGRAVKFSANAEHGPRVEQEGDWPPARLWEVENDRRKDETVAGADRISF